METLQCLVCGRDMMANNQIKYTDHYCSVASHLFVMRIRSSDHSLAKLSIRFNKSVLPEISLCLKVHYDEGYSEVWTTFDSLRIRINQIVVPDFSDLKKLRNKIRMLLVFA